MYARSEISVSSVIESDDQPPASSMHARRHIPAVPLKLKNRPVRCRYVCSMMKCPSMKNDWMRVSQLARCG